MWYVIFVRAGHESHEKELIEKIVPPALLQRCVLLRREVMRGRSGVWSKQEEVLLPGYLLALSDDPVKLHEALRDVPGLTKLLGGNGTTFAPLQKTEASFVEMLTADENEVMAMSEGIIEGDAVIVHHGPLKGYEALVRKVDRHKRVAFIEFEMFGRHVVAKTGLEIVRKFPGQPGRESDTAVR